MRRWLFALFTLHFCLSVGMFSFAHADVQGVLDHAHAAQAVHADAPDMLDVLAQMDEAEHGLSDGHADIPEFIPTDAVLALPSTVAVYRTAVLHGRASPPLAGLDRPPILPCVA
ncbi:MAG: hypothetical protein J0H69_10075 [Burkholderiales bacterium]|nr:hypothetical protein [Burkholderiales bacterium]